MSPAGLSFPAIWGRPFSACFVHGVTVSYNAAMLTYACIIAFLLFGYMWLMRVVLRQENARFARRRQWRAWILGQLTKEPPESEDQDKPRDRVL
jgi:hypothetical protein